MALAHVNSGPPLTFTGFCVNVINAVSNCKYFYASLIDDAISAHEFQYGINLNTAERIKARKTITAALQETIGTQ